MQWLAIGLGAAFGAIARAWLARFNNTHEDYFFGTLLANVIGGLCIGAMLVIFDMYEHKLPAHARMFIVTGFLGGLTTFSTFSAEVFTLFQSGKVMMAVTWMCSQVIFTVCATTVGYYLAKVVL